MRVALAVLLALALTACRQPHTAQADNRILWSEHGCAFHVEPHLGDTSFVTRLPDADEPTCPTQEAQQ